MDRKCTALVGEALRLIAALSRSKDETEIRAAENRDAPWNWRMRRNRVRSVDSAGRARAMTIRIAASILVIFAVGGAPVETSARGGAFIGGPVAPFHSGFQTPMSRAAIAPARRVVTPAPMIRPAIAPPRQVVAPARIRAVPLTHIQHRRAPVVVWGYAPWYSGDDGWYSGYSTPASGGYDNWTSAAPAEQNPSDTNPPTDPNARNRSVGCTTQTYKVPSADDGGERAVNVVRC